MQSSCVLCIPPLAHPLSLLKGVPICLHPLMDLRNYWFYSCRKAQLKVSWVCILYNLTINLSKRLSVYSVYDRHNLALMIIVSPVEVGKNPISFSWNFFNASFP